MRRIFVLLLAICGSFAELDCDDANCPSIPKHYEEMDCEPIKNEGECCVNSFKCPELKTAGPKQCVFKNEILNQGERASSAPTCSPGCICAHGKIQCSHIDCPKLSIGGGYRKQKQNCIKQSDINQCCDVKTVCGAEVDKLATCIFEGDTYREGQKMYPQNDCYKCVCTSDFDNSTSFEQNQSCKKIDCGISIRNIDRIRVGCIPVYYKQDNCCPIGWRCPGEKHMIESETYKSGVVDGPKCKFGKWELNVGQSLDVEEDSCHNCTCTVPPMLHCLSTC